MLSIQPGRPLLSRKEQSGTGVSFDMISYMISHIISYMILHMISHMISCCAQDCVVLLAPYPNNSNPVDSFNVTTDFDLQGDGLV